MLTAMAFLVGISFGGMLMMCLIYTRTTKGIKIEVINKQETAKQESVEDLLKLQKSLDDASENIKDDNRHLDGVIEALNDIMNGGSDNE